jgi:hypothetical protein
MVQTTSSVASIPTSSFSSDRMLCYYQNSSDRLQILRLTNVSRAKFEGIVFPSERILFEADPDATLEIHNAAASSQHIPCQQLSVKEVSFGGLDPV